MKMKLGTYVQSYSKRQYKDKIKKGKTPKAIIVVHLYGLQYKVNQILAVANKYNIPIIEDAAEVLGS